MAERSAARVLRKIDNTRAAYHRPPLPVVPGETRKSPAVRRTLSSICHPRAGGQLGQGRRLVDVTQHTPRCPRTSDNNAETPTGTSGLGRRILRTLRDSSPASTGGERRARDRVECMRARQSLINQPCGSISVVASRRGIRERLRIGRPARGLPVESGAATSARVP